MSIIINGKFYKDGERPAIKSNSNYKVYSIDRQREDHRADIVQRFKGGKINPEFIKLYPEEAAKQFTKEQIREVGNQYGST